MFTPTRLAFILLVYVLSCYTVAQAQVIITSLTPTTVCVGSSVTVSFTNNDADRSSFSLYLYPVQSTDSLAISQEMYISGNGSLYGLIPYNQSSGNYRVGVKKVSSNGIPHITKSDSFSINAIPPAPIVAVNPIIYCQYSSVVSLTATAINGGELNWYSSSIGGISSHSITPQTAVVGTNTYYVSQTVSGCESPRIPILVAVTPLPPPPTVTASALYICQGVQVFPVLASGSNLKWYNSPVGGTASTTFMPATDVAGTFTYYVSQTVNGCESPRASLSVTVRARPTITITADELTLTPSRTSILLTATASSASLVWSTGDTTSSILVKAPDVYSVLAKDANGCTATSDILIDQSSVNVLYSLKAGDWNNPSVWSTNQVPTGAYAVRLHHIINVPTGYQAQALALRYRPGGQILLNRSSYIKTGP